MRTSFRVAALALVAALTATACGNDDPTPSTAPTVDVTSSPSASTEPTDEPTEAADEALLIEVREGEVVGGVPTIEASVGETVTFRVLSDVADQVHVHGVDHHVDVAPGVETTVEFTADIPGQFEIELEDAELRLADLVVR